MKRIYKFGTTKKAEKKSLLAIQSLLFQKMGIFEAQKQNFAQHYTKIILTH